MRHSRLRTRALPWAATFLAGAALAATLHHHLRPAAGKPSEPSLAKLERGSGDAAGEASDASEIAGWHLFGTRQTAGPPVRADLPESAADLHLKGILFSSDPETSYAIIAASGTERSYRIGQRLPGNARLHAVAERKVVIERGSELESLSLPEPGVGNAMPTGPAVSNPQSGSDIRTVGNERLDVDP